MNRWSVAHIATEIREGAISVALSPEALAPIRALTRADLHTAVTDALARPQPRDMSRGRRVLPAVLAAQYLELLRHFRLPTSPVIYEPCVGASDPVIVALEAYADGRGRYTAINLNDRLRRELEGKTAHLRTRIDIISADAGAALAHLAPASFDAACFHHAINDILQTAVATPRGMDTRRIEWWSNERQMIEWLAEELEEGTIDARARSALISVVAGAAELVRPGGVLIFDHWTWFGHQAEPWFPWDLFNDMLPLARDWIGAAGLPLAPVDLAGADPRWWMAWMRTV